MYRRSSCRAFCMSPSAGLLAASVRICTVCFLVHFLSYFEGLVFPVVVVDFTSLFVPLSLPLLITHVFHLCTNLPCSLLLTGLSLYSASWTSCGPFVFDRVLLCPWISACSLWFGCLYQLSLPGLKMSAFWTLYLDQAFSTAPGSTSQL